MVCIKRKKRLGELRQAAKVQRYGSVIPISRSDFVSEVSQAPPDVWLATKYPATKFVKIISTDCIPNYPDCNLPTLLLYNNGVVKANYVGLHNFGRRCTPEVIMSLYVDTVSSKIPKDVEDIKSAPVMKSSRPCKDVGLSPSKDVKPRLFIDVEDPELKSKLNVLESKLSEIVALKNENSELSKKLDVALGKIEA
ncbi:Phosducin-like protein 3 [Camellia lanceoleosa]|uniref:Phosducin-like protein 3 n=1 Tax=Camellia lanceoleosa TaxID=1840588 RepID=A0ACC0GKT4_9ERIC|nr:Phosducin-like protein 3 [Camellia lanceoleosa]